MSPWRDILRSAQKHLVGLLLTLLLCLGALYSSDYARVHLNRELNVKKGETGAQSNVLAEKEKELADIHTHIGQFRTLQKQGLLGTPNRAAWVEQLLVSRRELRLPETLTYNLKSPQALSSTGTLDAAVPLPGTTSPVTTEAPLAHDFEFTLRDIHEDELLALVRHLQENLQGRSRLQSCRLDTPGSKGLVAQCTLRLFTLPQKDLPGALDQQPLACRKEPCC